MYNELNQYETSMLRNEQVPPRIIQSNKNNTTPHER